MASADNYQMLEELGSGSFGVVYKAYDKKSGKLVAIKLVDLEESEEDLQEIQQEISLLSSCSSRWVTKYKASFVRGTKLWIVMEFLGGGSCLDLIQPLGGLDEAYIAIICRELLNGLDYLHRNGKIHRDIKSANVLLSDQGHVKLADFGVAAQLMNLQSVRMTFVGTPFWMAPEVIQEVGYDFKADLWSLGITALEMAYGAVPRSDIHPMKALFHIPKEPAPRLEGDEWSRDFKDFIKQCLRKDPDVRPTAKELLGHRFIRRAGKVEALRELIERKQMHDARKELKHRPKYYEETMREAPARDEKEEWLFDTVKQSTIASRPSGTVLRSKRSMTLNDLDEEKARLAQGLASVPEFDSHDFAEVDEDSNSVRRISSVKRIAAVNAVREAEKSDPRRKFSTNWDDLASDTNSEPFREFESLRLEDGPLGTGSPARQSPLPKANSPAVRKAAPSSTPKPRVPSSGAQYQTALRQPSGQANPTARRVSGQTRSDIFTDPPEKSPLNDDLSFGNTPSGIRQFSRGLGAGSKDEPWAHLTFRHDAEDHELKALENETKNRSPLRQSTVPDENTPPPVSRSDNSNSSSVYSSQFLEDPGPQPKTRDGLLGQRAHMKAIVPAAHQAIAESGSHESRNALSEAAEVLQRLERVDPAGLWTMMKGITERMTGDNLMAKNMKIGVGTRRGERSNVSGDLKRIITPQESPLPGRPSSHRQSPADFKFPAAPAPKESRLRSNSARRTQATPSKALQDGDFKKPATPSKATPSRLPRDTPNKPRHTPSKSQVSPSKLILASNNPHLKSHHRRRQSALVLGSDQTHSPDQRPHSMLVGDLSDIDARRMPGYSTPGLEHVGQLANALYGRWAEGLGSRWGAQAS